MNHAVTQKPDYSTIKHQVSVLAARGNFYDWCGDRRFVHNHFDYTWHRLLGQSEVLYVQATGDEYIVKLDPGNCVNPYLSIADNDQGVA